jgi:inner membrane protein
MEPVTHILTGAVLSRAGLNRRTAYATVAMMIAAEFPDIDLLAGIPGPVTGFEHHRGITHTFLAMPFQAAVLTGAFYAWHRFRKAQPEAKVKVAPAWGWLFGATLLALLSHLLLDWTNNYGLRPFFPFDPHWYAGSFVFIFEPVLFLMLVLALVLPALFGLINAEVGARKPLFRGRPSAIAALVGIAALYLFRYDQRNQALLHARAVAPAETTRIFASPYPVNPFEWHVVTDTPGAYLLSTVNNRSTEDPVVTDTLYKSASTMEMLVAKRTYLGRIYLDWSQYPVITELPETDDPHHPMTAVTFSDARFYYNSSLFHGRPENGAPPVLAGTVLLDMTAPEGQRVVETRMAGRLEK